MAGIIVDGQRLNRTRAEFDRIWESLGAESEFAIRELKAAHLYRGRKRWSKVDGANRRALIGDLCTWLTERKHDIALAAVDKQLLATRPLDPHLDAWMTCALHIALQIQRAHQRLAKNKGHTFLVFDENRMGADALAELLFAPPAWTDQYYGRKPRQERLDQVIDTAFYARSHHVGLVQIADLFAYLFRRYAELRDYGDPEAYGGELRTVAGWVEQISERLVALAHRCPKRPTNDVAEWYVNACPTSLRTLQRT